MSRPMNLKEFSAVVNFAKDNNSPITHRGGNHPVVKYIDPVIDLRDNTVFSIRFRQFAGGEKEFYCANEFRDEPRDLYDRVMAWLKGEEV